MDEVRIGQTRAPARFDPSGARAWEPHWAGVTDTAITERQSGHDDPFARAEAPVLILIDPGQINPDAPRMPYDQRLGRPYPTVA
jgi:hypothetical protein